MAKTKTAKAEQQARYLIVTETREAGISYETYFHLRATVTTQKYENHTGYVPYGLHDDYDGLLLSGLRVSCQGDESSRTRDHEPVYGFSCEYRDVYSVDRRKAERMHKTLSQLETKLAKFAETRGYVQNFGDYLGRIAESFGCAGMAFDRKISRYNDNRWDWMSVGDGVNRANRLIWQWREDAKPKPQETETDTPQTETETETARPASSSAREQLGPQA